MLKNKLKFYLIFLSLIIGLAVGFPVKAAELNFKMINKEIRLNDQFEVLLLLTTTEEINALEARIAYPQDLVSLLEIKPANSLISYWLDQPQVQSDTGEIYFSGIMPGGFSGQNGQLLNLVFQANQLGQGQIKFNQPRALLNDGQGSEADLDFTSYNLAILPAGTAPSVIVPALKDNEPPESFVLEVARDLSLFNGQYFLVFSTTDKKSGIDHYEVKEGGQPYLVAASPHLLKNQNLDQPILVRAIDQAGNPRIAKWSPTKVDWFKKYGKYIIIIIAIFLLLLIIKTINFLLPKKWRA